MTSEQNASTAQQSETLIVFHDRMFGEPLGLEAIAVPGVRLSEDPALIPIADAVVIHVPGQRYRTDPPRSKPSGQVWVAWSLESEANYPEIDHPAFDMRMTYQRQADVWIPYFRFYGAGLLDDLVRPNRTREAGCTVASFISSPVNNNGRLEYLAELDRHIDIHHFGSFMRNRRIDYDNGREAKLDVLGRYGFAIAFENSSAPDYVTEKYFDPLLAGAIPIYMGAPNIADFAPGTDCHILARDFENPAALARYLRTLIQDPTLSQRHLEWKTRPLATGFADMVNGQCRSAHPFVCLARLVKGRAPDPDRMIPTKSPGWSMDQRGTTTTLVNKATGAVVKINNAARYIWALVDGHCSLADIQGRILMDYPNARGVQRDVIETVRLLEYYDALDVEGDDKIR